MAIMYYQENDITKERAHPDFANPGANVPAFIVNGDKTYTNFESAKRSETLRDYFYNMFQAQLPQVQAQVVQQPVTQSRPPSTQMRTGQQSGAPVRIVPIKVVKYTSRQKGIFEDIESYLTPRNILIVAVAILGIYILMK